MFYLNAYECDAVCDDVIEWYWTLLRPNGDKARAHQNKMMNIEKKNEATITTPERRRGHILACHKSSSENH